jgi:hypothetical protein
MKHQHLMTPKPVAQLLHSFPYAIQSPASSELRLVALCVLCAVLCTVLCAVLCVVRCVVASNLFT